MAFEFVTFAHSHWLLFTIVLLAVLYASVGHGGASGYLAAMALWGLAPEQMRPAALVMNVVVTCWLLYRFKPRRLMPTGLFWPLVLASTPMAFVGGALHVDADAYRLLLGGLLLLAAGRMLVRPLAAVAETQPNCYLVVALGALLGFAAGLTGIGGGVYLSPILVLTGWCSIRASAVLAAGFILLNSLAGLGGYWLSAQVWPTGSGWLVLAALAGSLIGAELATHRASSRALQLLLALVLAVAALKMLAMAWV